MNRRWLLNRRFPFGPENGGHCFAIPVGQWDANLDDRLYVPVEGVPFEETQRTMFCPDLFHQNGDVEPLTSADIVGRSHQALKEYQASILAEYVPYTPLTAQKLKKLADLKPKRSPSCMALASQVPEG